MPATPEPLDAEFTSGIDGRPLPGDDDDDSLAEAAHARRTMIGRSAEEVDHAPRAAATPRPGPQTVSSSAPLRWAAPQRPWRSPRPWSPSEPYGVGAEALSHPT
ncbi:hypothetical protein [Streptomyces sp. MNU103]|uniref:hypothetical protein n=1 Tax=Streptomyces sp. MNU103 TaxID=2560024 RepID=UPI003FD11709